MVAPVACQPGTRLQAQVHGNDPNAGGHQCEAAKNRAKLQLERTLPNNCANEVVKDAGNCRVNHYPARNACP